MQRKYIVIVIVILVAIFLACGDSDTSGDSNDTSASAAGIASADLAFGFDQATNAPIDVTDTFSTEDVEVHCVIKLESSTPNGTKLKVVWTSIDSDLGENEVIQEQSQEVADGSYAPDHVLTMTPALQVGTYKADIYLNDQLDRTLEFYVEE